MQFVFVELLFQIHQFIINKEPSGFFILFLNVIINLVMCMIPYITIFGKQITLYIIMSLIGIFVVGILACYLVKKKDKDENDMLVLLLVAAIGLLVGGHLLYALTKIDVIIRLVENFDKLKSFKEFINILVYIFGGSVFYGGLIGGLIAGYIYVKKKKLDKKLLFDIGAVIIPLFHMFGRVGCFLSGCCYGIESDFGFTYTKSLIEQANGVNRFPIQLVEASYNLILFILLFFFYKKEKFKGKLIYLYLILYPIGRFIFEFFRGDEYRGFIFGLSTSQFISILLFCFSVTMLLISKLKIKKASR